MLRHAEPDRLSPEQLLRAATFLRSWLAAGHIGLAAVFAVVVVAAWYQRLNSLEYQLWSTRTWNINMARQLQPTLVVSILALYILLHMVGRARDAALCCCGGTVLKPV